MNPDFKDFFIKKFCDPSKLASRDKSLNQIRILIVNNLILNKNIDDKLK